RLAGGNHRCLSAAHLLARSARRPGCRAGALLLLFCFPYRIRAMAFTEPVLTKRIPLDPSQRKLVWYDDYVATGGYAALRKAVEMQPDEIINIVKESNLRGRGGAGFSAEQKWSLISKENTGPHYPAVNADESELGTFKDRYLI